MKQVITIIAIVATVLFATPCLAADVTFQWDANAEPVTGYRLYCAKQAGGHVFGVDSPDKVWEGAEITATVNISECGKHYFVVTAFDDCDQESGPSNEVDAVIKPHPPNNLR